MVVGCDCEPIPFITELVKLNCLVKTYRVECIPFNGELAIIKVSREGCR